MLENLNKSVTFTEAIPYLLATLIVIVSICFLVYLVKNNHKEYDIRQNKFKSWRDGIDNMCNSIKDPIVYSWSTTAIIFDQNNKIVYLRFFNHPNDERDISFEKITSIERVESGRIISRVDIGSALIAGPLYANRVMTSEKNLTGLRLIIDDLSDPIIKIPAEPYSNKESFLKLCVTFETIIKSNSQTHETNE